MSPSQDISSLIDAANSNLQDVRSFIHSLPANIYTDDSVAPYHASVGGHVRHVLDIFDAVLRGIPEGSVDLSDRKRDQNIETIKQFATDFLDETIIRLEGIKTLNMSLKLIVSDDLGKGPVEVEYTLGALLCQAHSHAIHHFACIGYILDKLSYDMPTPLFGYNPTTPTVSR